MPTDTKNTAPNRFLMGAVSNVVETSDGIGLMVGLKTVKPTGEVVKACMEKGVLCLTAKDKVRLLPALNIPKEILAESIQVIKEVCAAK